MTRPCLMRDDPPPRSPAERAALARYATKPGTSSQKRLALFAAVALFAAFLAANIHLIRVATRSQPACALVEGAPAPAKRSC